MNCDALCTKLLIANANFNAQVLNLDTYIHLRQTFKDDFIVKAYFLEYKLVGFLTVLKTRAIPIGIELVIGRG